MPYGFSFIELLISLLLLALVLLGFDAMEIYALRETQAAYFFSVAENQLHSMVEHLYALEKSADISQTVDSWDKQNHEVLPHGKGYVVGVFPNYKITIFWGEKTNKCTCPKKLLEKNYCLTTQVNL